MSHEFLTAMRYDTDRANLPPGEQRRVNALETACMALAQQVCPTLHFAEAAEAVSREVYGATKPDGSPDPSGRSVSAVTMQRLYYRWKKAKGDWHALIDGRISAVNRIGARTAQPCFRSHLGMLAARHKRSTKEAIKELYREWSTCQTIPGYEGLNYKPGMPPPAGWSEDNLRRLMPDKKVLTIVREGVRAAATMLPQVSSTRVGLWPCAVVMFDDVWLDCLVRGYAEDGKWEPVNRPLQLGCLDYFTGKRLCWGTKLRRKREDGTSVQLNDGDMLMLLCDYLHNVGYSPRGTVLVVENGTAKISEQTAAVLSSLTKGLVRVECSGMQGRRQVGAFGGRGVGNPRHKAALESWHNVLHNAMDAMLTQVGKDRHEPEMLHGIRDACDKLEKAGSKLSEAQRWALSYYTLDMRELADSLARIVSAINNRTDHQLEGWERMGYMVDEFYLQEGGWLPLHQLSAETRLVISGIIADAPERFRRRPLSPQEVWERETAKPENRLVRLSAAECVVLLGGKFASKLKRQIGGFFSIKAKSKFFEELQFESRVQNSVGQWIELANSVDYYGIFNPFGPALFVLDERGRCLGEAPLHARIPFVDEAAKLREYGRVQARKAEQLHAIGGIVAPDTARYQAQQAYNRDVLENRPHDLLGLADAAALKAVTKKKRNTTPLLMPLDEAALPDSYAPGSFPS